MEAKYKLAEANYFLDRLKDLKDKPNEFGYNLSAFISAWTSVFDYLLYDYAEKYFGWPRKEPFYPRYFEVAAKISKIKDAQAFIQWYKKQDGLLNANAYTQTLRKKRVVIVHRHRLKVKRIYPIYLYPEAVPEKLGSVDIILRPAPPSEMVFEDYKNKDIVKICETAYEQMKKIVEEAENTFK